MGGGGNTGGSFECVREWGVITRFGKASSDSGEGGSLRSVNGRRRAALISEYIPVSVHKNNGQICGSCLPSTAWLNSTALVSPTKTYSCRSVLSSSDSPGMTDPSGDSGVVNGRLSGGRCKDGGLDTSAGDTGLLGVFAVGLWIKTTSARLSSDYRTMGKQTDLPDPPSGDAGPSARFPGLKLNLLGGIITFGSNTSGGMTR